MTPLALFVSLWAPIDPEQFLLDVELSRFPSVTLQDNQAVAAQYAERAAKLMALSSRNYGDLFLQQCHSMQAERCWRHLRAAQDIRSGVCYRWEFLELLELDLGAEAYSMGWMPPAVPWWRFVRIDP